MKHKELRALCNDIFKKQGGIHTKCRTVAFELRNLLDEVEQRKAEQDGWIAISKALEGELAEAKTVMKSYACGCIEICCDKCPDWDAQQFLAKHKESEE